MDRLRVALIGPGFIAQRHLEVLSSEPGAELVGISSRSLARAEAAARRFGGRPYDDIERMLDAERPDAVWVCVTPDAHGALELGLIERGIHLFVEKPLAADAGDAGAHQRRRRRRRPHRGRRLPLAGDGHAQRAGGRDREPSGQAAQRPLARQPPRRRLVARPRHQRRPDGGAGDPPRGPLAPAAGRGDGRGGHRRPPPAPGLPGDGRPGRLHGDRPLRRRARSGRSRRPASWAGPAPRRSASSPTTSRSRSASRGSCTRTPGRRRSPRRTGSRAAACGA